jgi:hypothetical protein
MKAPITEAIDALVGDHVAPLLKRLGFRKKGQRFARNEGDCVQVIQLERWKYNEGAEGKFSLTAAVFHPAVWHMVLQARPGWVVDAFDERFPPTQNCLLEWLVLPPAPERGIDNLWPLDVARPLHEVADKVARALEGEAWPWLQQNAQLKATLARLSELSRKDPGGFNSMQLLCAAALAREQALADQALAALLSAKPSKFFPDSEREAFKALAAAIPKT